MLNAVARALGSKGLGDRGALGPRQRSIAVVILSAASISDSNITQRREHAGFEVVEEMAVERPESWIIGVERYDDPAAGRHQHGVAHRPGEAFAIDLNDLKLMPVQVHGMRHRGAVGEDELDPFALCER